MTHAGEHGQARESPSPDPERVHAVFLAARSLTGIDRQRALAAACGEDRALRSEVESLLAHDALAETLLDAPLWRALSSRTPSGLVPGDRLGPYRLDSFLARGGAGMVFVATDERNRRRVALKVLSVVGLDADNLARLGREADAAAATRHPHVVRVLDHGQDTATGVAFCAMRLVEGPSLQSVLDGFVARGVRPDAAERRLLLQRCLEVADGLAALHARGLVHRDVKPANIVLDAAGRADALTGAAVLVDLGLATDVHRAEAASTLRMTFAYAAPEQLLGQPVGWPADVFALGVTLHDLIAGRSPQQRKPASAGKLGVLTTLAPDAGKTLAKVVATATDPEPSWRYPDAAALRADLDAVLHGRRISAPRVPRLAFTGRRMLRLPQRILRGLGRVTIAVGACLVILLAAQQGRAIWRTRTAVASAYAAGDLAALAQALAARPALATLFLPGDSLALETTHAEQRQEPVQDVIAVGRAEGWPRALERAACYLQRDGLIAQPVLARFLARALACEPQGLPLRLTTRLLFERPDRDDAETTASAEIRAVLLGLLGRAPPSEAMPALVALAGCADASTLQQMLERCAFAPDATISADDFELERVVLRAAATMTRRLAARAGGRRVVTPAASRALFEFGQRALAHAPKAGAARNRTNEAVLAVAVEIGLAERARTQRFAEDWDSLLRADDAPVLHAARGDVDLRGTLAGKGKPAAADVPDRSDAECCERALRLGFLAGLIDDATCTERLRTEAIAGMPANCTTLFELRRQQARGLVMGVDPAAEPDADSLLGTELAAGTAAESDVEGETATPAEKTFASWDFCTSPPRVAGARAALHLTQAAFGRDEIVAGATYLRLHRPGRSTVLLPFDVQPLPSGFLRLRLEVQKNVRAALPYDGHAEIDVLLDGQLFASAIRVVGSSTASLELPLCAATRNERRQLGVRLGAGSTTPLRIYQITLLP